MKRDFYVTHTGRVFSGNKEFSPVNNGLGYFRVTVNGETKCVHRMVWEFFNGPIPVGLQINHKDLNKGNNALSNLELVTPSQNRIHYLRNAKNRAVKKGKRMLSSVQAASIKRLWVLGLKKSEIASDFGVCRECVRNIILGYSHANS